MPPLFWPAGSEPAVAIVGPPEPAAPPARLPATAESTLSDDSEQAHIASAAQLAAAEQMVLRWFMGQSHSAKRFACLPMQVKRPFDHKIFSAND